MEKCQWNHDDIFCWKGGQELNIFLHHPFIVSGYGKQIDYMRSCIDMLASVALLQLTIFSSSEDNIHIFDESNNKDWKQEWPKFPENDNVSCNLLLGTVFNEDGMRPGNGRVFAANESKRYPLFWTLFHEQDLGTLLLLKAHESLWCRMPFYRKLTDSLGYGIWNLILYYYFETDEIMYNKFYYAPNFKRDNYYTPFVYRDVATRFGSKKELCLVDAQGNDIDNTYNLRKFIVQRINS